MKTEIYFVLYVALVLEVLIAVLDRDVAEERLRKQLREYERVADSLADVHSDSLRLDVPEEIEAREGPVTLVLPVLNLLTPEERRTVEYSISYGQRLLRVVRDPSTGVGRVDTSWQGGQTYTLRVSAEVSRHIPEYLPEIVRSRLLAILIKRLGGSLKVASNTSHIRLKVIRCPKG